MAGQFPRRFNAAAAGRIVRYAKEAGETDEAICLAIAENGGLKCGECDCVKLKVLLELALGVFLLAAAIRARNKEAMRQAIDAISKAQRSSKIGNIEILEEVSGLIFLVDDGEDQIQAHLDKLNDEFILALKNSFDTAKDIQIIEPE